MKTVKEAADKLLEKGLISKEECEGLKKEAAGFNLKGMGAGLKNVATDVLAPIGLAGLGIGTLTSLLHPLVQRAQSAVAYDQLTKKVPSLAEKDPEQVKDYFNVVRTFSPKAATNPLVAGALVNKMIEFGGVDHKLVQDIASIQSAMPLVAGATELTGAAAKSIMTPEKGPSKEQIENIATTAAQAVVQ